MTNEQYQLSEKLRSIKETKDKIKALESELKQIFAITQKATPSYERDGSQSGSNSNSAEDNTIEYLAKSDNLCKEINLEKRLLLDKIEKVKKIISVCDADLYSILSMIYISCWSIEKTAEELERGTSTIKRKRNLALQKIIDNGLVWSN